MSENSPFALDPGEFAHSIEAEQSVIGSVLADPSVLPQVLEKLKPDYFYSENHKKLFSIISRMFTGGVNVDVVTLLNEAVKEHVFETAADGKRYLSEIAGTLPTVSNVDSYCKIVADKYYIRALGYTARSILEEVREAEQDAELLIDSAEQKIYNIRQGRNVTGLAHISDAVLEAYDRLGKITGEDKDKYMAARSGFSKLDEITSGLNKSDLIIIAARPAMGKTSFAMNIATNVAKRSDKNVVVFNLEMGKEQLATRLLSTESLIESSALRSGRISTEQWVRLAASASFLSTLHMYIDDTGSITVQQMKAKLRRVENLGLVVIDYLQLMGSSSRSDNRVQVISEITRQLKLMAKELDVPILLLSQLSRAVDSRPDKRPVMSDLRESGSIEQDADIVLFLYRDDYYNPDTAEKNISECIISKNRHGETGKVKLVWNGQFTRFSDLEYTAPPEA